MKIDLLAIAPHPDDVELTCGGTMLKMAQAGYRTGIVGKWHLSDPPDGFDYSCVLPGQGVYFDPELIEQGTRKKFPGYCTDVTTDLALNYLKRAGAESGSHCS